MPFHMPAGKCTRSRAWGTQVISKTEFLAELYPIFHQIAFRLITFGHWLPVHNLCMFNH